MARTTLLQLRVLRRDGNESPPEGTKWWAPTIAVEVYRAANENLAPQSGENVVVRDPALARHVADSLGPVLKIAEVRGGVVTLVAAADYEPNMIVPRTIAAILATPIRYYGVSRRAVRVVEPSAREDSDASTITAS
jgi:hypothetical protein